jgi:hypothetical protein
MAKKLFRVDWFHDGSPQFEYIIANTESEASEKFPPTDLAVRLVTFEEEDAYMAGFEDGHDVGVVEERLSRISQEDWVDIEDRFSDD